MLNNLKNNFLFALLFRGLSFILAFFGLIDIVGVFINKVHPTTFLFYTIQSNIVVILFFLILFIFTILKRNNKEETCKFGFFPRISSVLSMDIFVTMLVFWVLLLPSVIQTHDPVVIKKMFTFGNMQAHLITPILMIFDYIFFNKRGKIKKFDSLYCVIFPYVYLLTTIPLGLTHAIKYELGSGYYPYYFIDADKLHWWVVLNVFCLTIVFLSIYVAWQLLDHYLAKKQIIKESENKKGIKPLTKNNITKK
ncbi:MAG: Pr6Pr family membrane protein [Mycoplasmataceae bacterium]|nr:Pr6Pr family membrane protein [Mycoplasmataceae bacterium]